jgi:hypothetical protein
MYAYQCPSCGGLAYTSANAATVGACPHCSAPLGTPLPVDPRGEKLPRPVELSVVKSDA